jgi:hypothetical protein
MKSEGMQSSYQPGAGASPSPARRIPELMEALEKRACGIMESLMQLKARLTPVLAPVEMGSESAHLRSHDPRPPAPLAESLGDIMGRLEVIDSILAEVNGRLDL